MPLKKNRGKSTTGKGKSKYIEIVEEEEMEKEIPREY